MTATDQTAASAPLARRRRGPSFRTRLRLSWQQWWFAYAMLVPVALVMGVLVFYPLVRGILFSFTDADRFSIVYMFILASYHYFAVDNYTAILTIAWSSRVIGIPA